MKNDVTFKLRYSNTRNTIVVERREHTSKYQFIWNNLRYFSLNDNSLMEAFHKARKYAQNWKKDSLSLTLPLKKDIIKTLKEGD